MIRTFIQISALWLTLISAILLVKSALRLKDQDMAKLASTYWDFNKASVEDITGSRADATVGSVLLFLGFLLQMINSLWPMRIDDFGVDCKGVIWGTITLFLIGGIGFFVSNYFRKELGKIGNKLKIATERNFS